MNWSLKGEYNALKPVPTAMENLYSTLNNPLIITKRKTKNLHTTKLDTKIICSKMSKTGMQ